jgi:peptidoglycan/LPS O-acetylase OafA/YrhL
MVERSFKEAGDQIQRLPERSAGTLDRAMQGLRGVGATLVLLNHFGLLFADRFAIGESIQQVFLGLSRLSLGSSTFIVISAYYSYRAFHRDPQLRMKDFLKRRARAILPLYWFILTVYVVMALILENRAKVPQELGEAFAVIIVNALLIAPLLNWLPIITVSWTLTYIALGYLSISLLALALRNLRTHGLIRILMILGFGVTSRLTMPLDQPLFAHNDLLATGVLLYELQQNERFRRGVARIGESATVAAFALFEALRGGWAPDIQLATYLSRAAFCTGIGAFCASRYTNVGLLNHFLESTPLQHLGRMSYSMYLSHGLPLYGVKCFISSGRCADAEWLFWCLLLGSFVTSVCLAALLERLWRAVKRLSEDLKVEPHVSAHAGGPWRFVSSRGSRASVSHRL